MEICFEFSGWNKINKRILDLNKRIHRKKHKKYIEELLDTIPIEDAIFKLNHNRVIKEALQIIDRDITYLMNKVRQRIEGQKRNILFSGKKF